MRWIVTFTMMSWAIAGSAEHFYFKNYLFNLEKIGKIYLIFPKEYSVSLNENSRIGKNDCKALEEDILIKEKNYDVCDKRPHTAFCSLLKDDILFKAKEEHFHEPYLFPKNRVWELQLIVPKVDELEIKNFVATRFQLNIKELVVVRTSEWRFADALDMTMSPFSLLSKVTKLVPLAPGMLEPLSITKGKIYTNNRFLACDLENHRLRLESTLMSRFYFSEATIDDDHLAPFWRLFQQLEEFVLAQAFDTSSVWMRAALTGHFFATKLKDSQLDLNVYPLSQLLNDFLFEQNGYFVVPQLRSKESFKHYQFPDKRHSADFQLTWSYL